jgi:hypothetical protein
LSEVRTLAWRDWTGWLGSIYRYAVALEMLSGVVAMGALIWLIADHRLRIVIAVALLRSFQKRRPPKR